ncbi:MAG: class I SAM-dependent methyltransferase [Planctomycetota bacterium]
MAQDAAVYELPQTIDAWDEHYYKPIALRHYDRAVRIMLDAMRAKDGQLVLDAGCGTGVHSVRTAKYGCNVRSIDISNAMLDRAKQNAESAGVADRITFSQENLTALTLEDNSVDHAFSWGVVVHIKDLEAALAHLNRVIRPGGSLALQITNTTAIDHRLEDTARALLGKKGPSDIIDSPFGKGLSWDWNGEEIFTWRMNAATLSRYMRDTFDAQRTFRGISELTEFQRWLPGFMSTPMLLLNRAAHVLRLPASLAATQLLVFRMPG